MIDAIASNAGWILFFVLVAGLGFILGWVCGKALPS